jgi:hypothetical protein
MRTLLASILSLSLISLTTAVHADTVKPIAIPEKVSQNILKRHPKAQELQASHESHFGKQLLEVSFKDEAGQPVLELFNQQGHLYTNEVIIEDFNEIYPQVVAALKATFPKYELKRAEMIGNPNGVGQEYEIYLNADGVDWKVSVSGHGVIQDKQQIKS